MKTRITKGSGLGLSLLCATLLSLGTLPLLACGGGSEENRMEEAVEEIEDEAQDAKEEIEDEIDDRS